MLGIHLGDSGKQHEVLCLGAHCDDIEIGAGGTVLSLLRRWPGARFTWVVFSSSSERRLEAQAAAQRLLGAGGPHRVWIEDFRNGYFPYVGAQIKDYFESLKDRIEPDLILTHWLGDRHQDHRTVAELTWNTFRNHTILEYEIPKLDGDLMPTNFFVPLSEQQRATKLETIMSCFTSQLHRPWFTESTFSGLMRLRGVECNAPSGYAEGFHARKLVLA